MDVHVGTRNYLVFRGIDPYKDFLRDPLGPWDLSFRGTEAVDQLRKKLLKMSRLKEPAQMTVRGTLYPCALLSPGWWDRQEKSKKIKPLWSEPLQKWLFQGFDLWGPSWDFCWDFDENHDHLNPYFISQLGDGDESDSIPILIPHDKAEKLREEFREGWGGVEAEVTGLLGHRDQFSKVPGGLGRVGGLLDYCIWLKTDEKGHKIALLCDETELYSGYLWKCVAPAKWLEEKSALDLNQVYFI